jgi:DNA repair exonuclease SbcCD ATPase subunit
MEEPTSLPSSLETATALSTDALRELRQRTQNALKASREHAARLEADITRRLDEIAETLSDQVQADDRQATTSDQQRAEIARLTQALDDQQKAALQARQSLELEREELKRKASELEVRNRASQEEWRSQLLDFEARLRDQHQSWNEQRAEWTATRTGLERERDELQQKFELALEDVQRLRERGAELEHDLARRPAVNQSDSTELVALRAERDALSQRVEELEQRPPAQLDPEIDQQLHDLQRRFELAVEDVRELKTKNIDLESRLVAASGAACRLDTGAMDWESQKRRLLAALEETTEAEEDEARRQERVTIEGTIEITDSVVAEKDRLIAELESQLGLAQSRSMPSDADQARRINDLIDADEVIAAHRERHQQLEREIEEKLRATELELSVERAKMARQKAELEELKAELDAQRQLFEANGGPVAAGAPKRRWLSKFGIDGNEKP